MIKFNKQTKILLMSGVCFSLFACAVRENPAPIVNITTMPDYLQSSATAIPAAGGTPVSGATTNTVSQPKLTALNADDSAVTATVVESNPSVGVKPTASSAATPALVPVVSSNSEWIMPTQGSIISNFSSSTKGIDFSGTLGQSIVAVNDGKVVYSGSGLKGYGNLIIIKHSGSYLTAYAHNKANLVQEGATVKRGQKIATMGNGDNGNPVLHFELRSNGKPIDPLSVMEVN